VLGAAVALAATAVVVAVRYGSAASLALALAAPSLEGWRSTAHPDARREEIAIPVGDGRALRAHLYRPAREEGAVVLVHGLSPAGRQHPDLVRLAFALARRGQLVLVPHFDGLAAFRLSGREVDDVRASLAHLRALSPRAAAIAGFSFGAGPALLPGCAG
jgi:predicted alpha/beta-fold hydrolase